MSGNPSELPDGAAENLTEAQRRQVERRLQEEQRQRAAGGDASDRSPPEGTPAPTSEPERSMRANLSGLARRDEPTEPTEPPVEADAGGPMGVDDQPVEAPAEQTAPPSPTERATAAERTTRDTAPSPTEPPVNVDEAMDTAREAAEATGVDDLADVARENVEAATQDRDGGPAPTVRGPGGEVIARDRPTGGPRGTGEIEQSRTSGVVEGFEEATGVDVPGEGRVTGPVTQPTDFGDTPVRIPESVPVAGGIGQEPTEVDVPGGGMRVEEALAEGAATARETVGGATRAGVEEFLPDELPAPGGPSGFATGGTGVERERFGETAAAATGGVAALPFEIAGSAKDIAEFGGAATVEFLDPGKDIREFGAASAQAGANVGVQTTESAIRNPERTAGQLLGTTAASVGAIGGARRFAGPRAGRAVSFGIQPGEDIVRAGIRRDIIPEDIGTTAPGVRSGQIETEAVTGPELSPRDPTLPGERPVGLTAADVDEAMGATGPSLRARARGRLERSGIAERAREARSSLEEFLEAERAQVDTSGMLRDADRETGELLDDRTRGMAETQRAALEQREFAEFQDLGRGGITDPAAETETAGPTRGGVTEGPRTRRELAQRREVTVEEQDLPGVEDLRAALRAEPEVTERQAAEVRPAEGVGTIGVAEGDAGLGADDIEDIGDDVTDFPEVDVGDRGDTRVRTGPDTRAETGAETDTAAPPEAELEPPTRELEPDDPTTPGEAIPPERPREPTGELIPPETPSERFVRDDLLPDEDEDRMRFNLGIATDEFRNPVATPEAILSGEAFTLEGLDE